MRGPWDFKPAQRSVVVHPGQMTTVEYEFTNVQNRTMTAQAIPSYAPGNAAPHFTKVQCFCFNEWTLGPGETRRWPVVFVVEDDAQNGPDHVDAHRSLCMVASPWAKRGFVGHQHYSFGSIFKTFWNSLGVPCLNQYDASAADLGDLFSQTPDYQPFMARQIDARLFDPQKALDPFDEKFDWKAAQNAPDLDDVHDMKRDRDREDGKVLKKKKQWFRRH